jgi:hypothetical protein
VRSRHRACGDVGVAPRTQGEPGHKGCRRAQSFWGLEVPKCITSTATLRTEAADPAPDGLRSARPVPFEASHPPFPSPASQRPPSGHCSGATGRTWSARRRLQTPPGWHRLLSARTGDSARPPAHPSTRGSHASGPSPEIHAALPGGHEQGVQIDAAIDPVLGLGEVSGAVLLHVDMMVGAGDGGLEIRDIGVDPAEDLQLAGRGIAQDDGTVGRDMGCRCREAGQFVGDQVHARVQRRARPGRNARVREVRWWIETHMLGVIGGVKLYRGHEPGFVLRSASRLARVHATQTGVVGHHRAGELAWGPRVRPIASMSLRLSRQALR